MQDYYKNMTSGRVWYLMESNYPENMEKMRGETGISLCCLSVILYMKKNRACMGKPPLLTELD